MTPSGMPVQNPPCGLSNRGGPGLTQRVQRTLAATTGTPVSMMSAAQNNLLGAEAVHSNLHSTQATVECNVERMRAVQGQCIAQQYRPWPVAAHGQSKWMHDKAPSMPRATRSGQTHVQTSGMASTPRKQGGAHNIGQKKQSTVQPRRTQTKRTIGAVDANPKPCGRHGWTGCVDNAAPAPTIPVAQTSKKSP